MSHDEQPPLIIRPGFSRLLAGFVLATHLAALAVTWMLPIAWYWRTALGLLVLSGLLYQWTMHVRPFQPRSLLEAVWEADGTWTLVSVSGEASAATLLPSTFVGVGLVVLNLRLDRFRSCSMVLLPDNLDLDLLRRLRVRLRQHGMEDPSRLS